MTNHNRSSTPPTGARLRQLAFAYLARREYSQHMLSEKLLQLGADPAEVQNLVIELADSCYQSDARMASMTLRANMRRGRGLARLRQDLQKYQICEELISDEIAQVDWLAQAIALRVRKFGQTLPSDPKEKARQFRFLQYRGFDAQTCQQALKHQDLD